MDLEPMDDTGPSLVARLALGIIVVVVALTIIGWIIGAILSAIKFLVVVVGCIAIIWAIASARAGRD